MPLRDHFHEPLKVRRYWEGFWSAWTCNMVRQLNLCRLSPRFRAAPRIRLGAFTEVESISLDGESNEKDRSKDAPHVVWMASAPDQTFPSRHAAQDIFEVRIHDENNGSRIVATVELVSPGNKDRPENRHAFAIKCAAYLQQRVSLIVVDVVTDRLASVHTELMELLRLPAPTVNPDAMQLSAVAYRTTKVADAWQLDIWPEQLALGQLLPTLPLWLASNLAVPLELEQTYEETCQVLRIR